MIPMTRIRPCVLFRSFSVAARRRPVVLGGALHAQRHKDGCRSFFVSLEEKAPNNTPRGEGAAVLQVPVYLDKPLNHIAQDISEELSVSLSDCKWAQVAGSAEAKSAAIHPATSLLNAVKSGQALQLRASGLDCTISLEPIQEYAKTVRDELAAAEEELRTWTPKIQHIERKANLALNTILLSGATGLLAQFFGVGYLTVTIGWDIMEPVTAMGIGLGATTAAYAYFALTRADFTNESMTKVLRNKLIRHYQRRSAFDTARYHQLEQRLSSLRTEAKTLL